MAKKARPKSSKRSSAGSSATATAPVKLNERDTKTMGELHGLAGGVETAAEKNRDPYLDIPSRTLSNVKFNKAKRFIEMGKLTNRRQLFNLAQAKAYMQTMLVAKGSKQIIMQGKTASLRQLFYMLKHTIKETKEETFDDQIESDAMIEDLEVTINALREELHVYASNRGSIVGPITLVDTGDEIDCSRMGSGGYSIPSIVEPYIMQFKKHAAKFVLHVEKDTVWRRFNEDKFWQKHQCILMHGQGQPPRGVRRLLHRFHYELGLPVYCLLDNDPWGYYIYSVIKQGSINLAFESKRMAVPGAKYLGLRSIDFERCELTPSVQIRMNDTDIKRAKQIAAYPWFADKRPWQKEIDLMLKHGFKLEVEALMSKDISYVTEIYVPERLAEQDWLD